MDPVRLEADVGGHSYQLVCKPWPYKVGRRWLARLLTLMAPAVGAGDVDVAVMDIVDRLTPELLEELSDECERHTDAVPIEGGKAVKFTDLTALLAGRYDITLQVVRAHVELQFAPFFASLKSELGSLHPEGDESEGAALEPSSSGSPTR